MSGLNNFYDNVVDFFVAKGDINKIDQYKSDGAGPNPTENCPDCKNCNMTCECRWCHFDSCAECDDKNCNIRLCDHKCHGDKGGRFDQHEPVYAQVPDLIKNNINYDYTNIKSNADSSKFKKVHNVKELVETKTNSVAQKFPSSNQLPKEIEKNLDKPKPVTHFEVENAFDGAFSVNLDEKNVKTRGSKFKNILYAKDLDLNGNLITEKRKQELEDKSTNKKNKDIIRFKVKPIEKDEKVLNEMEVLDIEAKMDIDTKKKLSLPGRLKELFNYVKIHDMKTPDKLDNHVQEKFKRDRSTITKFMHKLEDEIRVENYTEIDRLKANIFNDFEKQESWQSYTTLLFAEINSSTI